MIKFYPDAEVFETLDLKWDIVAHRLRALTLLKRGTTIRLIDERVEGGSNYRFYFDGGLKSFVNHLNRGLGAISVPPVYLEKAIAGKMVSSDRPWGGSC